MGVENRLPGFLARRVPARPEWVASSPRDPRTAARVYGTFALAFSTLFFALLSVGLWTPVALLFVPVVVGNAVAWTWALWALRVPGQGTLSRRRALTTGFAIGSCSWLTVGPLVMAAMTVPQLVTRGGVDVSGNLLEPVVYGLLISVAGLITTLGIPTIASVAMALWILDYEERSGRENRESGYEFV